MSKKASTREVRKDARAWMVKNDIRNVDIQRALDMKNHVLVSETVAGKRSNFRVLQYLVSIGCPVEYLDIPKRMRKEMVG